MLISKIRVNLDEVQKCLEFIQRVNSYPLESIEWFYSDENWRTVKVHTGIEEVEEWRFTGLSNKDFAEYVLFDRIK